MNIRETELPGVWILEPRVFDDARGAFYEFYNAATYRDAGLPETFVQDNQSESRKDVLRGLHYQLAHPQGKLVRCIRGAIFDVAVDLRRDSPHFGKWTGVELTEENRRMLWVPPKFAHGFVALTDAHVLYKCTTLWDKDSDRSLLWSDPEIGIRWPVASPQLAEKDAAAPPLREAEIF
ncbi:MAG TPA: dTDP-4-dehydrorhamnose 3,5-epimerase [Thermoanaerobaculia bacterium]|nr:dTDP-4-dehydrorhamnose 3,5-epimerase [Thermoanaerobaculia bacterium]